MLYKKKPVVVEAFKYDGDLMSSNGDFYVPQWMVEAYKNNKAYHKGGDSKLYISTLEGEMTASVGDYIIKGVQGEIYPCKPDIFIETYEPYYKQIETKWGVVVEPKEGEHYV